MKCFIYKITSPSGMVYIGQTSNTKNRFRMYKRLNCKSQPALYNSLNKYGFDNHKIEIIDECNSTIIDELEKYYINLFDSFKNGLNCTIGGHSGFMRGELNISKLEHIRKINSIKKLEYYKNNIHPSKGKKHKKETIDIIKYKRKEQGYSISVYILDVETGIYYYGLKDLSKCLNIEYKKFFYQYKYRNMYKNRYVTVYESRANKTT